MIVENHPGGNGIVGGQFVAKSPPDGYILMSITSAHITIPILIPPPYDPIKDFTAVATLASYELILVVHPSVPANNLQQFIALAKATPGQLNYATSSTGTSGHLTIEMLSMRTGIKMQHIPYKGSAPALTDLIGGQIELTVIAPSAAIPHIKSGRLKAIAVSGEARLRALQQVPTFTESGLRVSKRGAGMHSLRQAARRGKSSTNCRPRSPRFSPCPISRKRLSAWDCPPSCLHPISSPS